MSKRNIKPKGPEVIAPDYTIKTIINGIEQVVHRQGYQGKKGWRYHPTKGFRKDSSFEPIFP